MPFLTLDQLTHGKHRM